MSSIPSPLERAISGWRNWSIPGQIKPQVVSKLQGGLTNTSYLLSDGHQQLVLRLNSPHSRILGIDRQIECQVLELVSANGLAPRVYFNDLNCLVTEFLSEEVAIPGQDEFLKEYQNLLNAVHKLTPDLPKFDYLEHTENYWRYIVEKGDGIPDDLCLMRSELLPVLEKLTNSEEPRVLCHHDPGFHNLCSKNNRLMLIDWEYAGLGLKHMDYAASGLLQSGSCDLSQISHYQNRLWYKVCEIVQIQ